MGKAVEHVSTFRGYDKSGKKQGKTKIISAEEV